MLTNESIALAPVRGKAYKMADANSLYVYVSPTGSKSLRWKYRYQRREKLLTVGTYPHVTIEEARRRVGLARNMLRAGVDPLNRDRSRRGWHRAGLDALEGLPPPINNSVVYFVQVASGHIKIGVTTNIKVRMAALQHANAEPIALLGTFPGGHAHEGVMHRAFADTRDSGEWFSPTPELLDFINSLGR